MSLLALAWKAATLTGPATAFLANRGEEAADVIGEVRDVRDRDAGAAAQACLKMDGRRIEAIFLDDALTRSCRSEAV